MKFLRAALLRSLIKGDLSHQHRRGPCIRSFSSTTTTTTNSGSDTENKNGNSFESNDDFEQRIFRGVSGNNHDTDPLFKKLDKLEEARGRVGFDFNLNGSNGGKGGSWFSDGLDESSSTLLDGMDGRLRKAAKYFEFDDNEVLENDYSFRPDAKFIWGGTYEPKDLDLTKTTSLIPPKRYEFEVITEEVLRKADFRNVKFLAKFLTQAGIIIKRSQTRISAKAQRKVAREIKTARAFGLMPFTTMGQYPFVPGVTREDHDEEDQYERYNRPNRFVVQDSAVPH